MKVPPSMMKPAGKMAFTPHIERYFPTRGPEIRKSDMQTAEKMALTSHQMWKVIIEAIQENSLNALHKKNFPTPKMSFGSPNIKSDRWMIPKTAPNCVAVAPFLRASMG